jgi:hypothetical protein
VPAQEVIVFAELMNELELQHIEMFGDSINSAIVTNVKAADLKGQRISIRGLSRVIGLQPSTIRRRIAHLVGQGWLAQDGAGVHFPESARDDAALRLCSEQARVGRFSPASLMRAQFCVAMAPIRITETRYVQHAKSGPPLPWIQRPSRSVPASWLASGQIHQACVGIVNSSASPKVEP